ncbi:MAG: hypothetical protein ACYCXG_00215 [Acidiferrobacter sp.]
MYKILDGKRYDTAKAIVIADVQYSLSLDAGPAAFWEDENCEERREGLYRTAAGALFVATWANGGEESITAVNKYEALEWAERYQHRFDIEAVIEALGGMEALGIVDA